MSWVVGGCTGSLGRHPASVMSRAGSGPSRPGSAVTWTRRWLRATLADGRGERLDAGTVERRRDRSPRDIAEPERPRSESSDEDLAADGTRATIDDDPLRGPAGRRLRRRPGGQLEREGGLRGLDERIPGVGIGPQAVDRRRRRRSSRSSSHPAREVHGRATEPRRAFGPRPEHEPPGRRPLDPARAERALVLVQALGRVALGRRLAMSRAGPRPRARWPAHPGRARRGSPSSARGAWPPAGPFGGRPGPPSRRSRGCRRGGG